MAFNLFATDKQQNYPGYQQQQQQGSYGMADFATDKAANYPSSGNQQQAQAHQQTQPQPVVQQQTTPVKTAKDAVRAAREAGQKVWGDQGTGTLGEYRNQKIDPNSATSGMDAVIANMYTSPEQEEKMRKASVANQRILAIGDALRHIGNIYNTVNYAPSQQFNKPWEEEYNRYQQGKAVRDAANQRYLSYRQQKAAQDRVMAKMEMDFKFKQADDARKERLNDARVSRYNAQNSKDAANQAYWETRARLLEEGWPLDKAIKEARKAQIDAQTRLTTVKADQGGFAPSRSGGGQGGKYWDYDEEGNIHYYPNKTMWEQGVESHSRGQKQQEEFKTIDGYGEQKVTYKKRPTVSKAGENASNANKKKTQPKQTQKKALPGQEPAQPKRPAKKRLPGT